MVKIFVSYWRVSFVVQNDSNNVGAIGIVKICNTHLNFTAQYSSQ